MIDPPAIPAATLIVWRDDLDGPRILVVERSAKMAFAAGAIVFPGGRIDQQDHDLAAALGRADDGPKVTAIRETLEESAVAVGLGEVAPSLGPELQRALNGGEPFADVLARHDLTPDFDSLVTFARWMPAFVHARRFDTMFYLAKAPSGVWPPLPQEGECVAAEWAAPMSLIERIDRGEAGAIFPTKRNLERLAGFDNYDEVRRDALAYPIETIVPWIEDHGGEPHVTIPENRGYPVIREPLSTAFRA